MDKQFRNRAFLPIVMPLAILAFIAILVGLFALILLWNTRESALVLALVAAGGVLFAISLASSQDRLTGLQRGVITVAGVVPVLLGGAVAVGVWEVPDEELNINRTPHIVAGALEGSEAAVVATEFAFDPDQGQLTAGELAWTVSNEGAAFHTLVIEGLEGEMKLEVNSGASDDGTITLDPGEYVFYCDVPGHRAQGMEGTFSAA